MPLDLQNKLILAPMAGVSDRAFRSICIEMGADYTVTEMISAKALSFHDQKTAVLARILKDEQPIAIQIFGSEPELMADAARMLSTGNYPGCISDCLPAAIDINMGCPVHKIVSNGEGSALMKDPVRAKEIVSAVVDSSAVPVTVKMRAGYTSESINAVEIATLCEEAGAAAVTVHGRTRMQQYRPPVDLEIIREVKRAVGIPVIGNGEIMTAEDAVRMKEYTGCDSLMIARGAEGNPFLFAEIKAKSAGKDYSPPDIATRLKTALEHLRRLVADKGEYSGMLEARKHIAWYIKSVPGAPAMRDRINRTESSDVLRAMLEEEIKKAEFYA